MQVAAKTETGITRIFFLGIPCCSFMNRATLPVTAVISLLTSARTGSTFLQNPA